MLVGGFLVHTFIAITYRAPQTVEYEMPAYVALAVIIGYGVGQISNIKYQMSNLKCVESCGSRSDCGRAGEWNRPRAELYRAGERPFDARVRRADFARCAAGAIILSDWHYATPMWYLQQVEGLRTMWRCATCSRSPGKSGRRSGAT